MIVVDSDEPAGEVVRIRVGPFEGELATVVRVRPNGGLGIRLVDNELYHRVMHYRPEEVEPVPCRG